MLFLAIFEIFSWSSGRSKFGSAFIQTSVHTYILMFWRFDPKNPSRFLLDPSRTDMFLRWRFSFLCFIQAVFHHQSSLNIMLIGSQSFPNKTKALGVLQRSILSKRTPWILTRRMTRWKEVYLTKVDPNIFLGYQIHIRCSLNRYF